MSDASRAPVDHGLSGLGLVMQLGGSVFAALTALTGFSSMIAVAMSFDGRGDNFWAFLLTALGLVRSGLHRNAGSELLYGDDGRGAIRRYVWVGLAHTALWAYYLSHTLHAPNGATLGVVILFGAWPATMAIALQTPALARLHGPLPVAADKGFDGLGCIMAVLGVGGLLYGVVTMLALVDLSKGARTNFDFQAMMLLFGLLIVRSAMHVRAALRTLTSRDLDVSTEAATRYGNAGVSIALLAGAVMFLFTLKAGAFALVGLILVATLTAMLFAWPAAVRRFASERRFAGPFPASMRAQRSADGGLSSLGWLLLGLGVLSMSSALPAVLWGDASLGSYQALSLFGDHAAGSSRWWPVLEAGLQIWAAIALIGAGPSSRTIAMVYGASVSAITVYANLPLLRNLGDLAGSRLGDTSGVGSLAMLALAIVVPAATLLLALRTPPPTPAPSTLARVFE